MQIDNKKIPIIILCGGRCTRLNEETEFKPKPMIEIGGRPILWHIMKIYNHYGYRNFILALGYKGEQIKDYFLKQKYYQSDFAVNSSDNFNIIFGETGLETPHGERVLKLKKYIESPLFMVTYGDGVGDVDINKLVEFHKKMGKIATITGVHPTARWGLVNVSEEGVITAFDQKPKLYGYVNGGFMVLDKRFFDFIKPGDMIEDTLKRLISQQELAMYRHEGAWYCMDTYRDFLLLNKLWEKDPKWKIWKT